jgi:hypothetical protein
LRTPLGGYGRKSAPRVLPLDDAQRVLDAPGFALLILWQDAADGDAPPYAVFDPIRHPRALPGIQLVQTDPECEFRYRLVGTREVGIRGFDPAGRPVSEGFFGIDSEEVLDYYRKARTKRAPVLVACDLLTTRSGRAVADVSLFLPFRDADGAISRILCYSHQPNWP